MDSSKMETSCTWVENKSLAHIKCMWCIDEFAIDPKRTYESPNFNSQDGQNLEFKLSLKSIIVDEEATLQLQIAFQHDEEIEFEWKPFITKPFSSFGKEIFMNEYYGKNYNNQKNTKQAIISSYELTYSVLPSLRVILGCYVILDAKHVQALNRQQKISHLIFSRTDFKIFKTLCECAPIEAIKFTPKWQFELKNESQIVSPQYVAGPNDCLKWNFILVIDRSLGSENCDVFLDVNIEFRELGNYLIQNMLWKLTVFNPQKNDSTSIFSPFTNRGQNLKISLQLDKKKYFPSPEGNPLVLVFDAICFHQPLDGRSQPTFTVKNTLTQSLLESKSKMIPLNEIQRPLPQNGCNKKVQTLSSLRPHFTDVKLKIGDQEILAHKLILSAASPIFFEMLTSDENLTEIEIKDENFEAMEILIKFCYNSGKPDMNLQEAFDVLKVAHKYQIKNLKEAAENVLIGNINEDTAIDLLMFGDNYGADKLKEAILNYLKKNIKSIDNVKFEEILLKNNALLLLDIIRNVAE